MQHPPSKADTGSIEITVPTMVEGAVTWTIPIEVSVRIGAPPTPVTATPAGPSPRIVPATATPATATAAATTRMAEALAELERGRALPYYSQVADEATRAAYYQGIPAQRTDPAFFAALHELVTRTHTAQPRYDPSRHVYPWVDLRPNRKLRSIYTGEEYTPESFIQEDVRVQEVFAARVRERLGAEAARTSEALDLLEALLPYNCEHVVPQSWFGEDEPMRGDLHHLFACESRCNSFRGNRPYFEFPQFEEAVQQGCGMSEKTRFEPSHGKGAAARATFYFLVRYPGQINRSEAEYDLDRLPLLLAWHTREPVGKYERHRNAAIFAKQGNRNPFIDFPAWAAEVDFAAGLGDA